ncbi:MAG TPA: histidine kinase dimerization/phospho-acceptor domain-containing protein, partial [Prolixibacteraceae bacterium]|nr:histidine kinase dimerization/phospho-acceptor domain-containing protein [Prolixibacteraceae bacterium]
MKRMTIKWLIGMMVVALTGIIFLQVLWMKNALDIRNEWFDRSVNESLVQVSARMELLNDAFWVREAIAPPVPPGVHSRPFPRGLGRLHSFAEVGSSGRGDTLSYRYRFSSPQRTRPGPLTYFSSSEGDSVSEVRIEVISLDSVISDWEHRVEHTVSLQFDSLIIAPDDSLIVIHQRDLPGKIGRRVERLKNIAGKMAVEVYTENPIDDIDTALIHSLLAEELGSRGIPISYEYGIFSGDSLLLQTPAADTGSLQKGYATRLFPNAIYRTDHYVKMYFPGRKSFVLQTFLGIAFLSLVFCSFILAVFVMSIYYILNQKKISEMKSDFINNMTHEFKTPLATISVATDTIVNPRVLEDPERIRHFTGIIKKENQRMNHQVETILQIARLDRRDFEFRFAAADLHEIIDKAVSTISLQV